MPNQVFPQGLLRALNVFMAPPSGRGAEFLASFNILFCGIAYWLLANPYMGLFHDANIYAVMALRWLDPAAYARDLFFAFGSQDAFSLFSPFYANLIRLLGLDVAARLLTIGGALLWISAAWWTGRSIVGKGVFTNWGVLILAVLSLSYSPYASTFRFNESFSTARTVAMPLALLAVGFGVAGQTRIAWLAGVLATLFHPLMGVWSLLLLAGRIFSERRLVMVLLSGLVSLAALLFADVVPALQLMGPEWLETARNLNDVLIKPWGQYRLNDLMFWVMALLVAGRLGSEHVRPWYRLLALLTVWSTLLAMLCSYFYPSALLVQAQLWRVLWLAIAVGVFALIDSAQQSMRRDACNVFWVLFLAMMIGGAGRYSGWVMAGVAAVLFLPNLGQYWVVLHARLWAYPRWLAAFLVMGVLIALPGYWLSLEVLGNGIHAPWWPGNAVTLGFFLGGGEGVFLLVLAALCCWPYARVVLPLFLLPLLVLAASSWDARLPQVKQDEAEFSSHPSSHPLARYIHRGDVVAWMGHSRQVWFALQTGSYASGDQTTGFVFSRKKLEESRRRQQRLAHAHSLDLSVGAPGITQEQLGHVANFDFGPFGQRGIAYLCEDPVLDWVITPMVSSLTSLQPVSRFWHNRTEYGLFGCKQR